VYVLCVCVNVDKKIKEHGWHGKKVKKKVCTYVHSGENKKKEVKLHTDGLELLKQKKTVSNCECYGCTQMGSSTMHQATRII
jgi:hypothetical protein